VDGEEPGDEALVARARHGDSDALELIARRYDRYLRAICWRVLRNEQDTEDAVQEVQIRVLRSVGSLNDGSALKSWLGQIASRVALDLVRGRKPAEPIDEHDLASDQAVGGLSEEGVDADDAFERLIAGCTPHEQRILRMLHHGGWTMRELADHLGSREDTLKRAVARAHERIRCMQVEMPGGSLDLDLHDVRLSFAPAGLQQSLRSTLRTELPSVQNLYRRASDPAEGLFAGFLRGRRQEAPVPSFGGNPEGFSIALITSHLAYRVLKKGPPAFAWRNSEPCPAGLPDTKGQRTIRWNICRIGGLVYGEADEQATLERYEELRAGEPGAPGGPAMALAVDYFPNHLGVNVR
jgi:RNA polymerase sigma-70 factor (ECF subfamily)